MGIIATMVCLLMYGLGNYYFMTRYRKLFKESHKLCTEVIEMNGGLLKNIATQEESIELLKETILLKEESISLQKELIEELRKQISCLKNHIGLS